MTPAQLLGDDFELDIRVVAGTPASASVPPMYTALRCFTPWCAPTMWKCPPSRQVPRCG
jgi:hypothetical protein